MGKAQIAAVFLGGAVVGGGGERLLDSALAGTGRLQSISVWVARWTESRQPVYAGRVCSVDPPKCVDLGELPQTSAVAFEKFAKTQGFSASQ
jgi:hypothetical protein